MISKNTFDTIIRENINKPELFGYKTHKIYENYYNKQAFKKFTDEMKTKKYEAIWIRYDEGGGRELLEKKIRLKQTPPKMASVGSSSRFCYLALREGTDAFGKSYNFEFEYGLPINDIKSKYIPQLDAAVHKDKYFIECKCHEIFDKHTVAMRKKYWDKIYGKNNEFGFSNIEKNIDTNGYFHIPLTEFDIDKNNSMMDIKQLLCHLMGVASTDGKKKTLTYLFFKPKCDDEKKQGEINEVFDNLTTEIGTIFNSKHIQTYCKKNNIILNAYAEFDITMQPLTSDNIIVIY